MSLPEANNNKSDVFVLVPSYNHAPFIEKCLKSIIKQSLAPKKLLVIDDGSKDNSPEIIERILNECPFDAELIVRENRGLCATLNQGLSLSTGKYFAYIGSDDFWMPTFLEERVKLLEKRENAVLGYGNVVLIDENDEVFEFPDDYTDGSGWANFKDGDVREMLLNFIVPISSTVLYRRSVLEKVSWNEDAKLEDYELYLKLMELGEFAFDSQILSIWRHHGYNTSKNKLLMLKEVMAAQKRNIINVDEAHLEKVQSQIKFRFARDLLQQGEKIEALKLASENWRGAASGRDLAKFFLRIFVPMSVVKAKRKLRKYKYSQHVEI